MAYPSGAPRYNRNKIQSCHPPTPHHPSRWKEGSLCTARMLSAVDLQALNCARSKLLHHEGASMRRRAPHLSTLSSVVRGVIGQSCQGVGGRAPRGCRWRLCSPRPFVPHVATCELPAQRTRRGAGARARRRAVRAASTVHRQAAQHVDLDHGGRQRPRTR